MRALLFIISALTFLIADNVLRDKFAHADDARNIKSNTFNVLILKTVDHPALNSVVKGIKERLKKYNDPSINFNIIVKSAQGNTAIASQIAVKYINQKISCMIGVGTMASQIMLTYSQKHNVPLIFSSVTDPQSAGLVDKRNVFGVSNFTSPSEQIEIIKLVQKNIKKIGMLYNPSESNSIFIINAFEKCCAENQIQLLKQQITKSSDAAISVEALLRKGVEAVFVSNDNTALSALPHIFHITQNHKVPLYTSDIDQIDNATVVMGPDQEKDIGYMTGELLYQYFKTNKYDGISIKYPSNISIFLNYKNAKCIDLSFSEDIRRISNKSIDDNSILKGK